MGNFRRSIGRARATVDAVSRPWVLVFTRPAGDPSRSVGGLSLALRLALEAQRAGASGVLLDENAGVAREALHDGRLRIPVIDAAPEGALRILAPSSLIVHQGTLRAASRDARDTVDLAAERAPEQTAYAFDPIDVVDDQSAARAERALFTSLRKPQDGWTSRWLNRYVSLSLSRFLVKTPLSPNQVSVGILAVGLFGAWLAAQGTYASMLVGAFLFQAQSILDGCDGEMSRVTFRGSHLGEWLDTIGDDLTNYGFFAGAAIGLHAMTQNDLYLAAGGITVGCGIVASAIEYRYLIRIGSGDLLRYPTSQTASGSGPLAKIAPLFKRDTFVLLTLVAALFGLLGPMLVIFSIAAVGILLNVLAAEAKMAKGRRVERRT
jgi:phosphatidylglycerophosphate synthase